MLTSSRSVQDENEKFLTKFFLTFEHNQVGFNAHS